MPSPYLQKFKDDVNQKEDKYPNTFILESKKEINEVFLTFDDGPDRVNTIKILKILKKEDVKATFFFLGSNIKRYKNIVKQAFIEGHTVAGHGYDHIDFRKLTLNDVYKNQILKTGMLIKEFIGMEYKFFRPPYGAVTEKQITFFQNKGFKIINWSVDSFDWQSSINKTKMIKEVMDNIHKGAIVLLHSGSSNKMTPDTLELLIKKIKKEGYKFSTIDKLF